MAIGTLLIYIMKYIDGGCNGRCPVGNILILNFEKWPQKGESNNHPVHLLLPNIQIVQHWLIHGAIVIVMHIASTDPYRKHKCNIIQIFVY